MSRNLDRAMSAAKVYRETAEKYGSNHATCRQLADEIFYYVGRWDLSACPGGEARRVIPASVREAMGFHNIQDWRMTP
jgi:hypothetical protein